MFNFTQVSKEIVNRPTNTLVYGQSEHGQHHSPALTIAAVKPAFLEWVRYELRRSPATVKHYDESLKWVIRDIGDVELASLHPGHILELRRRIEDRGCKEARIASILNALRSLLRFSHQVLRIETLHPRLIRLPRIPRRDVVYLTKEEIAEFLNSIVPHDKPWEKVARHQLRFRALCEVLLGTGARISEILRLDRWDVNFERKEARTIGKGNKERVLFFTERSLEWLRRYLARRLDDSPALFVTQGIEHPRLPYSSVTKDFVRARRKAGIRKEVSAHILRHTMATTLLFNGCPIGHIKELLGHDRLDTTCRYYLGLDIRAAKEAHEKFLTY